VVAIVDLTILVTVVAIVDLTILGGPITYRTMLRVFPILRFHFQTKVCLLQ
jgi:hypothetical protein